jgi:hypothetical protein
MRLALPALCLVLLIGVASSVGAHQQKSAITRVLFNERTGHIEVMHRFLLHDAEHAVRELFDADADILASENVRERFADYVGRRFELRSDGRPLDLVAVGTEIDGRFLWVYQETPIPDALASLTVRHDALRDIWPAQVNLVNVERGEDIRSVNFEGGRERIDIELAPPH